MTEEKRPLVQTAAKLEEAETFIKNAGGSVSCWPKWKAVELVRKHIGWGFASPEEIELERIPGEKAFPLTGGNLTEEGRKKRVELQKQEVEGISSATSKDYTMKDLHVLAKEEGIKSFGMKKETLMAKLGLDESLKLTNE